MIDYSLTDDEYATLKQISYMAPGKLTKRDKEYRHPDGRPLYAEGFVPLRSINHIDVEKGTDLHAKVLALLDRNMVKFAGGASKTSLKRHSVDPTKIDQYESYYIGRGTYGHEAIRQYETTHNADARKETH